MSASIFYCVRVLPLPRAHRGEKRPGSGKRDAPGRFLAAVNASTLPRPGQRARARQRGARRSPRNRGGRGRLWRAARRAAAATTDTVKALFVSLAFRLARPPRRGHGPIRRAARIAAACRNGERKGALATPRGAAGAARRPGDARRARRGRTSDAKGRLSLARADGAGAVRAPVFRGVSPRARCCVTCVCYASCRRGALPGPGNFARPRPRGRRSQGRMPWGEVR